MIFSNSKPTKSHLMHEGSLEDTAVIFSAVLGFYSDPLASVGSPIEWKEFAWRCPSEH